MDQKIKKEIGILKMSYKKLPEQPTILGKVQGKGNIVSFWVMISSVILLTHV